MLDPGRYFAEAIYFLQYTLAQILWAVDRAVLSIAVIAESVNSWVTENVGYFVELLVNALSAPLGGMFILALTALGFWYALNNVVPTGRWVDPSKLFTYGLIAFFFFSSPIVVIDQMEDLRQSLNAGIDQALIDGAAGDIFDTSMNGTDTGLPGAIPDVNSDGVVGSFDLVAAFMAVSNLDELDSSEFPVDFEAAYFPFGDPAGIDLSDEADQELAKALASDGIERLFFALVAIPTAIAEHFLRLALTGVAMFLYLGVPIAMLFAFFIYTQAFLGAYLRQFINLLIETFLSVIIAAIMIGLLAAAAQQGIGLFIGASIITLIVLLWRIKSALKLAAAAFDLFGGAVLTGGAGGMDVVNMGKQAVAGTVSLAGAALTGGATMALGGAVLTSASALQADGRSNGAYLGTDPAKTDGRVRQLRTIAGYTLGRSETIRHAVEGAHEVRTLGRNFRDGEVQPHDPDILDYLRAGSSMSGFGSSPWLAMRLSPSLRAAYDQIGGRRYGYGLLAEAFDEDEAPVGVNGAPRPPNGAAGSSQADRDLADRFASLEQAIATLTETLAGRQGANGGPENTAPIPDWLREDGPPTSDGIQDVRLVSAAPDLDGDGVSDRDEVQDVNVVRAAPDLDRDGREDKYETDTAGSDAARVTSSIRLEGVNEARREAIHTVLERLQEPDSLPGQAAYQTLVTFTGESNASLLRTAVSQHTAGAVQEASAATGDLVAQYRAQQMSDADILATFQSGTATSALREALSAQGEATPLSDEQLTAVADMVLLPQRRLTRGELAVVIGEQVAAGATSDQAVAEAIGTPVSFGGQTGAIRGVMAGAEAMNLSPDDLTRLADLINEGLREAVQAELAGRGHRPELVRGFVSDLASLPGAMIVPQTVARRPQQSDEV
ncbi:MAG: hypothetical protein H6651_23575 [Ardenticatenales bacterium]|nr:hypothetical protein [Ardenticatenales bacterium]